VAKMILASTYCLRSDGLPEKDCIPFKEVFLHGLIRDIHGQKMSKSRPETCIDPLDMIEKYGTDAVRLSLIVGNTPGNDMRLFEEKIAGYRNFVNKIWNASRFAMMNVKNPKIDTTNIHKHAHSRADKWILTKLNRLIKEADKDMEKYRFSDAATKIYDFTWLKYCDWYLEISKGAHLNPDVLLYVLKQLLKLLHPFVPFVTEAIWSHLEEKKMLIGESWPKYDSKLNFSKETEEMELVHEIITAIRSIRAEKNIEPGQKIDAVIYADIWTKVLEDKREPLMRMARLENLKIETEGPKIKNAIWKYVNGIDIYLPIANLFDIEKEKNRLIKELNKTKEKIDNINKRLSNNNFLKKAPGPIIEKEKKVFTELEEELLTLQKKLKELENLSK
jgi:valyl-tRNA synthetase